MRVKTYHGDNAKTVLARIKTELGPEAVILSTRNYTEDDGPHCEMTAALEHDSGTNGNGSKTKVSCGRAARQDKAPDDLTASLPGWGQWHHEWNSIREHLVAFLKPQMDYSSLRPRERLALEYLEREGVNPEVVMGLYRQLEDGGSVLRPLARTVKVQGWSVDGWPQRFHAVAGPHGAGKTSTLLRMALMLKHREPDISICLVNTDSERSAGRLLLAHYAELTGMEYRELNDAAALSRFLEQDAERFDRVLVDLPGLGRDMTLERRLHRSGLDEIDDLCIHLVLSPHFAPAQLKAFLRQYYAPQVGSIVWTKTDECQCYGALVNVAADTGLPVSAVSHGPGLTDTLTGAGHTALWRMIFKHQLPTPQGCGGAEVES